MPDYFDNIKNTISGWCSSEPETDEPEEILEESSEEDSQSLWSKVTGLYDGYVELKNDVSNAIQDARTAARAFHEIQNEIGPIATASIQINQILTQRRKDIQDMEEKGRLRARNLGGCRKFLFRMLTGFSDGETEEIGGMIGRTKAIYNIAAYDQALWDEIAKIQGHLVNIAAILSKTYDTETPDE